MNLLPEEIKAILDEASTKYISFIQFVIFEEDDTEPLEIFVDTQFDENNASDLISILNDLKESYSIVEIQQNIDGGFEGVDFFLSVILRQDRTNLDLNIDESVIDGFMALLR